jgi:uncharacterized membrane protein YgcG
LRLNEAGVIFVPVFAFKQLSEDIGYVLYSALGSFYIPSFIMVVVYVRIFFAARERARKNIQAKKIAMAAAAEKRAINAASSASAATGGPSNDNNHHHNVINHVSTNGNNVSVAVVIKNDGLGTTNSTNPAPSNLDLPRNAGAGPNKCEVAVIAGNSDRSPNTSRLLKPAGRGKHGHSSRHHRAHSPVSTSSGGGGGGGGGAAGGASGFCGRCNSSRRCRSSSRRWNCLPRRWRKSNSEMGGLAGLTSKVGKNHILILIAQNLPYRILLVILDRLFSHM